MLKSSDRLGTLLLLTLAGVVGCKTTPETVSIDLKRFAIQEAEFAKEANPGKSISIRATEVLPEVPKRNLLVGTGETEAKLALDAARQSQERAYKEALSDLTRAYRAAAASKGREETAKLLAEYRGKFDALYGKLREEFEHHAERVGPLWTRLATLAGFPDKGNPKRLPPPADFIDRKEAQEAIEIRKQIALLDADYRRRAAAQIEDMRQSFRLANSDLEAQKILQTEAATQAAEREAKRVASEVLKGLEASMINEIERLEAVPGVSVAIEGSAPIMPLQVSDGGARWTASQRLVARADLFARSKGYRLVAPGPGIRDVTQEFQVWENTWHGR